MSYAVITIDDIDKSESDYMHFKDKSQKAWNCNVPELISNFAEGERYFIDYNETKPKGNHKYGSKYINRARFWKEADGPNTWPDKEPYTGGNYNQGGGSVKKDFDSETSKRQTAANCAMAWCSANVKDADEITIMFPAMADVVLKWVNEKPKSADDGGSGGDGEEAVADKEFGFE